MPEDSTPEPEERKSIQLFAAIAILLVAVISLGGSWITSRDLQRSNQQLKSYVKCQTEWNSFLHRALEARSNASAEATVAMDDLIDAVTQAKSADDTRAALAKYKAARANQVQKQRENPLPPPPDEVCEIK